MALSNARWCRAVALRAPDIAWHYFEGSEPIIEKYHSVLEPTLFAGIGASKRPRVSLTN